MRRNAKDVLNGLFSPL